LYKNNTFFRITGFLDSWPKLEKWFSKFGSLQKVDATQVTESVQLEVEKILEDTLNRVSDLSTNQRLELKTVVTTCTFLFYI